MYGPRLLRAPTWEPSSLKKQHAKALKLSQVRPFVLYTLRHTFLTRLGQQGVTCGRWRGSRAQLDRHLCAIRSSV